MCGIVGYHDRETKHRLREIVAALAHRGPDDLDVWHGTQTGLAATRLSLLDLEHGSQPMHSEDGGAAVVLNGEIYNHADLRAELERDGAIFRGRSDTEVLLQGFVHWGPAVLERLEGMFAAALSAGETLHLARDAFGMKPLFWWRSSDRQSLVFASEIKALLRFRGVSRRLDPTALAEQMVFGHTLGGRTLLAGIEQLAPGAHLTIERREHGLEITSTRFAQTQQVAPLPSPREATERIGELLERSVARQICADHPVATYLSGGTDSTLLACLRPDHRGSRSFVVADGMLAADPSYAAEVAGALGLDHELLLVRREPPLAWLADSVLAMEGPHVPSLALLSAARVRARAKAAICGEGADELLGGYPMHAQPEPYLARYEQRLARLRSTSGLPSSAFVTTEAQLAALRPTGADAQGEAVYQFLLNQVMPNKHLAIWDRGTMAASLEVRMPYLDRAVRDFAQSLRREQTGATAKALIVAAMRRRLPAALVDRIASRTKTAAPDALEVTRRRLFNRAAAILPPALHRRHPLRGLSMAPHRLVLLDLFIVAFVAGEGAYPAEFSVEDLYVRHDRELRAARQAAADALFTGS